MVNCVPFDDLIECVIVADANGNVEKYNDIAQRKLEYSNGKKPAHLSDIFPVAFKDETKDIDKLIGKTFETDMYRGNKTCFPVLLRVTKDKDNKIYCFAFDITAKKDIEKELAKTRESLTIANTNKNDFISNITHELRTPVNGVLGLTRSLYDTDLNPSQLDTVHIIERCCVNMSKIINDFLDFSKLEQGKLELENNVFNVREFINKAMASNVTLVNDKGLKLVVYVADDVPMNLLGDELRLTQVINNLISNAIKFTSVGNITLEVTMTLDENDYVELFFVVMDTGIGIAKENMDKLFKRFSQVDASITRRFGGTGLGLSICRQLVQMMGGDIKVESEEGKGSAFSFNVRLKKAADSLAETGVQFPSGRFVYEGNGQYSTEGDGKKKSIGLDGFEMEEKYKFGTEANMEEIQKNMEKLIICIDMENWDKAESFAGIIKNLAADDKDLKREVFRMELSVRKGDKEASQAQYEIVKQKLSEVTIDE